jgi:hypothetical protein
VREKAKSAAVEEDNVGADVDAVRVGVQRSTVVNGNVVKGRTWASIYVCTVSCLSVL